MAKTDWNEKAQESFGEALGVNRADLLNSLMEALDVLHELLKRAEANSSDDVAVGQFHVAASDNPPQRWVYFGATMLECLGWIEYGSGIGAAWLTNKGEIVTQFLDDFGTDSKEWPDWVWEV